MKIYRNFEELKSAPPEIYAYFVTMEDGKIHDKDFMDWYGGDVHLIETEDDLKEIKTTIVSKDNPNEWASILEKADSFDSCRILPHSLYVEVFNATTDAGGSSYFIPLKLANEYPTVIESINLSEQAWT